MVVEISRVAENSINAATPMEAKLAAFKMAKIWSR
jgi:hypothetical protein